MARQDRADHQGDAMTRQLELVLLDGLYALARLPSTAPNPSWVGGQFAATIFSKRGISVVCEASAVPADVEAHHGYRCLEVAGAFDLASVGVVAAIVQPLASAGISLFAYSTWDTDYILIQETDLQIAISVLTEAGHKLRRR